MTEFAVPDGLSAEELEKWAIENDVYSSQQIEGWKKQWQREWDENQKIEGKRPEMESWNERLTRMVRNVRILDKRGVDNEADIVAKPGTAKFKAYDSPADFIDLMKACPDAPEKCVGYAESYVWSPKDQEARMWLGMNDGMRVWLNGRKIHNGRYYSIVNWDDQSIPNTVADFAQLRKGWNHIVVKVDKLGGGWGFSVALVNYDNTLIDGLKFQAEKPDGEIATYEAPKVGTRYSWDEVREDYTELLPELSDEDIKGLTGLKSFTTAEHVFLFDVEKVDGSRVVDAGDKEDQELNNYLNWDWEAVAAVRYVKNGETRDLVFVRPEYYEEYVRLLPGDADSNILGTKYIDRAFYDSTPNRASGRYVLVIDGKIDGDYPLDEQELLSIKAE